jgi:hypothetical protein
MDAGMLSDGLFTVLITVVAVGALLWGCYCQYQIDRLRDRLDECGGRFAALDHRLRVLDCQVAPQHWTDEAVQVYQTPPHLYDQDEPENGQEAQT